MGFRNTHPHICILAHTGSESSSRRTVTSIPPGAVPWQITEIITPARSRSARNEEEGKKQHEKGHAVRKSADPGASNTIVGCAMTASVGHVALRRGNSNRARQYLGPNGGVRFASWSCNRTYAGSRTRTDSPRLDQQTTLTQPPSHFFQPLPRSSVCAWKESNRASLGRLHPHRAVWSG